MRPFEPRLLRLVPAARGLTATLAVTVAALGVAALATAYAIATLVTGVVSQGDWQTGALWVGAAFTLRALLAVVVEFVATRTGVTVSAQLRRLLLARWLTGTPNSGRSVAHKQALALQGTAAIEPYAARYLAALVAAAVVPVLAIVALLILDWPSAVIVIVTLPLLPVFAALIGARTAAETESRWQALEQLAGHFVDVMRGLPTLVAYGRARRQVDIVASVAEKHRRATMRTLRIAFLSSTALELLATISVALVAVTVGLRLSHGDLDLRTGLLAILLAPEAYWPIRRVGAEFHTAADGAQALSDIIDELDQPSRSPHRSGTGVVLDRVSVTYPGASVPVLSDVTMRAGHGLTAITGPSGSGKTTLLNVIGGLLPPSYGELRCSTVHYATQRPLIPQGTWRSALTLGATDASDQELIEALRRVDLDGVVTTLPAGLDSPIGDDGFGLSAGMRTRFALARATMSQAPVLLFDEPTSHLDATAGDRVRALLLELARDRTVIAATHDEALVAQADTQVDIAAKVAL